MNIGYRTVAFADRPLEEAAPIIADAGYTSIELCLENPDLRPPDLTPQRVEAVVRLLDTAGLTLAGVSYHGVDDQLEDRRQWTYDVIERLPDLGATTLIVASRREEPARIPAQWQEAQQHYAELADRCRQHQVVLAVEPQPGLVIRNAEDLVRILDDCDHPNLAGNLDIAHAVVTSDDLSWAIYQLRQRGRLAHVHLADVRGHDARHLVPGEGEIDFGEVRELLDGADYQGPLVIDLPDPSGDPADVCRTAIEALRRYWTA